MHGSIFSVVSLHNSTLKRYASARILEKVDEKNHRLTVQTQGSVQRDRGIAPRVSE